MSATSVLDLRCEHLTDPLGVDESQPLLSWRLESEASAVRQTSYRIVAGRTPGGSDLWDSGVVASDRTFGIAYAGGGVGARETVWWQVTVELSAGETVTSAAASWTTGASPQDWEQAAWVTAPLPRDTHDDHRPTPYLRRRFTLPADPVRALVHATAAGAYELHLNGERVGDDLLRPGWTDYASRIQYQTYDVTAQLAVGPNTLGGILGEGWYCGFIGFQRQRDIYGPIPLLRVLLVAELADGTVVTIGTDGDWQWAHGAIQASDMLMGEVYDARLSLEGWCAADPALDSTGDRWQPAVVGGGPAGRLVAAHSPTVREVAVREPQTITEPLPGCVIIDFGQNLVGWVRLTLPSTAPGTVIRIRHGEILQPDGTLYAENLRSARSTDTYIARGGGESWEPHFTFHGFRFVEVSGLSAAEVAEAVKAVVITSALTVSVDFDCDNPMVMQLQSNVMWGQRGNFLEVPTDCPQRDERLGWLGDAQIFARTACYNMDSQAFFEKWLDDVADATLESGAFPDVAPRVVVLNEGSPAWGDAGVIVPTVLHEMYGETRILRETFPSMVRWVEHVRSNNQDLLWRERVGNNYGEWLSIDADTPKDLLATAYFAHSARLTARVAETLGEAAEANRHHTLADQIAAAFRAEFVLEDGTLLGETQAAYVHALQFGLLTADQHQAAQKHLITDVERRGVLTTGFLGVAHLLPVLTDAGRVDLAYQLLLNEQFPSWGYSIRQGATTIWERWDGWTEHSGFQTPEMNSFNHYSFGSVAEWLYGYAGGLRPAAPGWTSARIEPRPGGGLRRMRTAYNSVIGQYACSWRLVETDLLVEVTVPANGSATVVLPAGAGQGPTEVAVASGTHTFTVVEAVLD